MAMTSAISADAGCLLSRSQTLDPRRAERMWDLGVRLVHVRANGVPDTLERLRDILVAELEPAGFRLGSVEVGRLDTENPASQAADARGRALRAIRNACRFAAEHGAEIVVVSPGVPERRVSYRATLDAARQTFGQAARYGRESAVRIALTTPATAFLRSPVELRELIDQIDPQIVGATLDLAGLVASGEPFPENWIGELGDAIALVRATNDSRVPWVDCLGALEEVGYRGAFVVGEVDVEASVLFLNQQLGRPVLEEVSE
jgi:sugar phosphate isomerase/epimerase